MCLNANQNYHPFCDIGRKKNIFLKVQYHGGIKTFMFVAGFYYFRCKMTAKDFVCTLQPPGETAQEDPGRSDVLISLLMRKMKPVKRRIFYTL